MTSDPKCIFCKIARGEIPSRKAYEDDEVIAFHDIRPCAPMHLLLVPKAHIGDMYEVDERYAPVLGRIMMLAGRLAKEQGASDGFRLIVNTGRVGRQEVQHVHVHVIGGPDPLGAMIVTKESPGE
ncbi:MAG TPA: histidine triad nucleotide-binding protein [Casimicrobiaceae bacterium]|nr:histidine triad nucleotide-binding protein [Casimicrobiaceae bacterium]